MISKTSFIILLLACMILISSGAKVGIPTNYTWPLNTKNLCFAGHFDLVINVDYVKKDGSTGSAAIPLNDDTFQSYSASCDAPANIHQLMISMLNAFTAITFRFSVDNNNITSLVRVYGYLTIEPNQTYFTDYSDAMAGTHRFRSDGSLFDAERGYSYRCNSETHIKNFTTNTSLVIKSVDVQNLRIQPFVDNVKEFNAYDTEKICQADLDKDSNLIPIIVGACLATLIVVVLVAYLIGRGRTRTGYQSV